MKSQYEIKIADLAIKLNTNYGKIDFDRLPASDFSKELSNPLEFQCHQPKKLSGNPWPFYLNLYFKEDTVATYYFKEGVDKEEISGCHRLFWANLLPYNEGLLLHAAGFIKNNKSGLFLGKSGAGKSTIVGLLKKDFLLSDDLVAVRKIKGKFRAYATFLGRETDGDVSAPLKGIFFLKKASCFSLERLSFLNALAFAWVDHSPFFSDSPPHVSQTALHILSEIFHQIPAYQLFFPKEHIDQNQIELCLEKN